MSFEHPTLTIRKGDSISVAQAGLALESLPEPISESDGKGCFYHLADLGFWVFFNEEGIVYSIRFDSFYPYPVEGIRIGDSKQQVLNVRGKPNRHFPVHDGKERWIYDTPRFLRVDFDPENGCVEKIFR